MTVIENICPLLAFVKKPARWRSVPATNFPQCLAARFPFEFVKGLGTGGRASVRVCTQDNLDAELLGENRLRGLEVDGARRGLHGELHAGTKVECVNGGF